MRDLFKHTEELPARVREILSDYEYNDPTYKELEEMLNRVEMNGYTFDFGLDGIPFNLRETPARYFDTVDSRGMAGEPMSYLVFFDNGKAVTRDEYIAGSDESEINEIHELEAELSWSNELSAISWTI